MPRIYHCTIRKFIQLISYAFNQLVKTATGEIGPANPFTENSVTAEKYPVPIQTDFIRAMSRREYNLKMQVIYIDYIAFP